MKSDPRAAFAATLLGAAVNPQPRRCPGAVEPFRGDPRLPPFAQASSGRLPAGVRAIESACFSCNTCCEVLVLVDERDGRVLEVRGDPQSPFTGGLLCAKGLAAADLVNNPERLKHPLRRSGRRGEGSWQRISWDEALDETAQRLLAARAAWGPQGVAFLEGTRRGWSRIFTRLANAFGAPNHGAAGWAQCLWPRLVDCRVTFGAPYTEAADFRHTRCILVWGSNPPATWPLQAAEIMEARQRGAALVVVDPQLSETAAKADLWLPLRPGTDTALALAMLQVIIGEGRHDRGFVERWCTGFDELARHVQACTPQWAAGITGIPAALIAQAARLYAGTAPACICRCVALDQLHDSVQACRAVSLLAAVTGNVGVPGGNILSSNRGEISQNTHEYIGCHLIDPEVVKLRRGYDQFPLLCGPLCPVPSAHMPTLWETMATGEPYPIKAAAIFGSNALVSYANPARVAQALEQLDFLVVADLFLTPTAERADLVLPASSWLERNNLISMFQSSTSYTIAERRAASLGEARSDVDIVCALARRLGVGQHFEADEEGMLDALLEPTGLSFRAFAEAKRLYAPIAYRQYEGQGFATPSGKVELCSSLLREAGCAPLPAWVEPRGAAHDSPAGEYPYRLTTGARLPFFRHTENRNNPLLREHCPEAILYLHPQTAAALGVTAGQWVTVQTPTGRACSRAVLTEGIAPEVVQAVPGWGGEQNINRVIPWEGFAEGIGTVPMRGLPCRLIRGREA